jgi:hypothetical protein
MADETQAQLTRTEGGGLAGVVQAVLARSTGRGRQVVEVRQTGTVSDGTTTRTRTTRTHEEGIPMKPETTTPARTTGGLSEAELAAEGGEALPDREAMSLIDANIAAPVNVAAALNVLSDDSIAYANAEQTVDIDQSN